MRRGDLVTIGLQGDFGKPRPALIIQADQFDAHSTVTVLPVTGTLIEAPLFRVPVEPHPASGLRQPSQVMVDKAVTMNRDKVGDAFGRLDDAAMLAVNRSLALFLGFG